MRNKKRMIKLADEDMGKLIEELSPHKNYTFAIYDVVLKPVGLSVHFNKEKMTVTIHKGYMKVLGLGDYDWLLYQNIEKLELDVLPLSDSYVDVFFKVDFNAAETRIIIKTTYKSHPDIIQDDETYEHHMARFKVTTSYEKIKIE